MLLDSLLRDDFKDVIKSRMVALSVTPDALAQRSGVSRATIYNILGGKRVTDTVLFKIARALDLNVRDLLKPDALGSAPERRKAR